MKTKLIYSNYNSENGESIVKIRNGYGTFTGISHLCDEDKKYESNYAGCYYAEMKATMKYMAERIKILSYQIKALENCYKEISQGKEFNAKSYEAKRLRKKIYILKKEKQDWKNKKESLHNKMIKEMAARTDVLKHLERLKKGKNN